MSYRMYGVLILLLALLAGCERQAEPDGGHAASGQNMSAANANTGQETDMDNNEPGGGSEWTPCPEQRPEVCTQQYRPVCGRIDTGIRCVTTPCPSYTTKTFGNACTACGHAEVMSFLEGTCESQQAEIQTE